MARFYRILALSISTVFVFASCGQETSNEAVPESSPVSIEYGSGCNKTAIQTSRNLFNKYLDLKSATPESGAPSKKLISDITVALKDYRTFIRNLELPTLQAEQLAIVDASENYLNALNSYVSSGFTDLSVNDRMIPFDDAQTDFDRAFGDTCYYDR